MTEHVEETWGPGTGPGTGPRGLASPRAALQTRAQVRGTQALRRLAGFNLLLIGLQPLSAGLFLSGYERAVTVHAGVAHLLMVTAFLQAVYGLVLWRRLRVPGWIAGLSVLVFAIVFVEVGFGYNKWYWLHVPVGVGMFGGLTRQVIRLDETLRASGGQA